MSYEVLAVGGSGQWFLLELYCRIVRDPAFPRPQAVWVVDPDWVPSTPTEEDKRGLAWVVQRSLDELMETHDANEGLAAFLARRQPHWEHR